METQEQSRKRRIDSSAEYGGDMQASTSSDVPPSKKVKETPVLHSRCWVFTTQNKSDYYAQVENAKIWVGPKEEDDPSHGIIYSNWRTIEEACPYWRKASVCKILTRQGIAMYNEYIEPIKNREAYVHYMYKTLEAPEIPTELMSWAKEIGKKAVKNTDMEIINDLYKKFNKRPKRATWAKKMMELFGFGVSETKISRSYRNWPTSSNKLLQKQLSTWDKDNIKEANKRIHMIGLLLPFLFFGILVS